MRRCCSSLCRHRRAGEAKQWHQTIRGTAGSEWTRDEGKERERGRRFFTWRGLVRAGEEEEDGALPTASDEGQAEPCDSSLWCCSGDRLSLLLSSSNAYESSCFGNLPWFTGGTTKREMGEAVSRPRQNRYREGFHMISPAHYNLSPLFCLLC